MPFVDVRTTAKYYCGLDVGWGIWILIPLCVRPLWTTPFEPEGVALERAMHNVNIVFTGVCFIMQMSLPVTV